MIEITPDLEVLHPKLFKKAKDCTVEQCGEDRFSVTPNDTSKAKRMVTFILTGNRMKALCEDFNTGDECPANAFKNPCYHVCAAVQHVLNLADPTPQSKIAA